MKSHTTDRFRKLIERLPQEIRQQAREAYRLFEQDPYHPQLHFKQVHQKNLSTQHVSLIAIGQ